MLYRIAASRLTLHLITICILVGAAGILTDQVEFLLANYQLDFIPGEVELEANIAILIAAFGVFLERLGWLSEWAVAMGMEAFASDALNRDAHDVGNALILIAIFMEAVNLLVLALDTWGLASPGMKFVEVGLLFAANVFAMIVSGLFGLRALRS